MRGRRQVLSVLVLVGVGVGVVSNGWMVNEAATTEMAGMLATTEASVTAEDVDGR